MRVSGDSYNTLGNPSAVPTSKNDAQSNGQCSYKKDGCGYSTAVAKKSKTKEMKNYDAVKPKMVYPRKGDSHRHANRRHHLRCAHQLEGCQFAIEHTELSDHEKECEFRRVPCPDGLCGETVKYLDLEHHIRESHSDADWEEESGDTALRNWFISRDHHLSLNPTMANGNSNNWVLNIWIHNGATFISRFRKHDGMWYSWVSMVGSASDTLPYLCIIRTAGDDGASRLTYEGPVHCIDKSEDEIIGSAECLVMTDSMVELFMEKVKKLEPGTEGYDGRLPIDYTVKKS